MAPRSTGPITQDLLHRTVSGIFEQAQLSLTNHRKNCITLHKLHLRAAAISQAVECGSDPLRLTGERWFGDAFLDMVNRVLIVKKGPAVVDRIVKFTGAYVKFMNEKAFEQLLVTSSNQVASTSAHREADDEETIASRFSARLLKWLIRGFSSKNKIVRYRAVAVVGEMITHLGEIDEDLYNQLRQGLVERTADKEALVRSHAVVALCKLAGSEDPDEFHNGEELTMVDVVMGSLCFDPAVEVRRAALVHIPFTPGTLPTILSRGRDVEPSVRKLVYSSILQTKLEHPRQLTISQREQVVSEGLGDREESVKAAASKVMGGWFDLMLAETNSEGGTMGAAVEFLKLFDVIREGAKLAADALLSLFTTRRGLLDELSFDDTFWHELTPESTLLARVFVDHCFATSSESRLEAASLPVVTAFAFHLQEAYNAFLELNQEIEVLEALDGDTEGEERDKIEDELAKAENVLNDLLRIVSNLDFADEIGRKKLFVVIKEMLSQENLPEQTTGLCIDIMRGLVRDERDFVRVIVEVIQDVKDGEDGEGGSYTQSLVDDSQSETTQSTMRRDRTLRRSKTREEMTAEERTRADIIDIRCLVLCIGMLERINGRFEENSTLQGLLGDLILPSVKRKELVMREKALASLGLCCLIDKNMALSSFQLYVGQVQTAPQELKLSVLRIVFDLLMMYDEEFFGRSDEIAERVIAFLLHTLETEESHSVQALLCHGISKLLLGGCVSDERVLTSLLMAFVSPVTSDNQALRQCLSYFFPAYCYSSQGNQFQLQAVFMKALDLVTDVYSQLDEDQDMIDPLQFGMFLVDWTDEKKLVDKGSLDDDCPNSHTNIALCILKALYDSDRDDEDRKNLCQLLGHLSTSDGLAPKLLLIFKILIIHLQEQCPFEDPVTDDLMERFKFLFWKQYWTDIKTIDEYIYKEDQEIIDLYRLIGVVPREPKANSGLQMPQRLTSRRTADIEFSSNTALRSLSPSPAPTPATQAKNARNTKPGVERSNTAYGDKENTNTQSSLMIPKKRLRSTRSN